MLKPASDKICCRQSWRTLQFAGRFSQILAVQAAQVSQRLCCSVTAHQLCSGFVFPYDSPPLPSQGLLFSSKPSDASPAVCSCPASPSPALAPRRHSLRSSSSAQTPWPPLQEQPKQLQCLSAGQNSWWFVRVRRLNNWETPWKCTESKLVLSKAIQGCCPRKERGSGRCQDISVPPLLRAAPDAPAISWLGVFRDE